jgi:hypothetical protein
MKKGWGSVCGLLVLIACDGSDGSHSPWSVDAGDPVSPAEARPPQNQTPPVAASAAGAGGSAGPSMDAGISSKADSAVDAASEDAGPMPADAAPPTKPPVIDTSKEVFRDELLRTYELTITDADWKTLQKTALDEMYVPAMLRVDGQAVGKIGVRYKGSYTLTECFMDGKQTCRKVSMKLKLDEYDKDLRFQSLKRLNLHSALNDHSHLHERVSYQLFRDFGVLAPRSVHARLMINGKYVGLYNLTEDVDGRFTAHNFSGQEGDGTLYKEVWPGSSQDPAYFSNGQQTNEGTPVTKIVSFATELAAANSSERGQVVARWMDTDYTLRYLAVHTAIKHWDGPLTFYCSAEKGCVNHNYFIYESPSQNRLSIVAWDVDNTFYDNVLTDMADVPEWYEPADECVRDGSSEFLAPACDHLVQGFNQLGHDAFRAALGRLLEGPFQVARLQADIDRWAQQIDQSVKSDPAGSGYEDWKANVAGLRAAIATFRTRAAALRDSKKL